MITSYATLQTPEELMNGTVACQVSSTVLTSYFISHYLFLFSKEGN